MKTITIHRGKELNPHIFSTWKWEDEFLRKIPGTPMWQ